MTFENIIQTIPSWLYGSGAESGIVISSRARLARNVTGIPYAHRASPDKLAEVVMNVLDAGCLADFAPENFFANESLTDSRKNVFIERHLISPALASKNGNRGVLVKEGECESILVNEEDHLRIQSIQCGFEPMRVLKDVSGIDDKLSKAISFSFSRDYGYLTACPTNIGTGLRVSVLIHLPALVLTQEIQKVIRSTGQLGLAVRGYYGEGSEVIGNLFQISNQRSLGKTGFEIVEALISVVSRIIDYEKQAADTLMKEAQNQTEDKIWRSIGILKTARVLSTHELMNLSSAARFGLYFGVLDKRYLRVLNELLVLTHSGHLQERAGRQLDVMERDLMRAEMARERFIDVAV